VRFTGPRTLIIGTDENIRRCISSIGKNADEVITRAKSVPQSTHCRAPTERQILGAAGCPRALRGYGAIKVKRFARALERSRPSSVRVAMSERANSVRPLSSAYGSRTRLQVFALEGLRAPGPRRQTRALVKLRCIAL
jgi:hypothetical protein